MLDKNDVILDKEEFTLFGEEYIAIEYSHGGNNNLLAVFKKVANMKGFSRDLLKQYGVTLPKEPKDMTTQAVIKQLIKAVRENKLEP